MLSYLVERVFQSVLVLLVITLVGFVLFRYVGDPVLNMVGQDVTQKQIDQMREDLGLNDPLVVQYVRYLGRAATGQFGMSFRHGRPVIELFAERLPATIELVVASTVLGLVLAIPLGVFTGIRPHHPLSQFLLSTSLIGVSLPTFLIGILLILTFSVILPWLPSFGRGTVVNLGAWTTGFLTIDGWKHLVLPSVTLGLFQLTVIMRLVRSEMMEVLRTDYIKFARARGIRPNAIYFGHALRNTLIPVITITGLQLGGLLAFAIVTETVFQWPGMGLLFLQALSVADLPVMSGYLLVVGIIFVSINFTVDMLYLVIDPRLREGLRAH